MASKTAQALKYSIKGYFNSNEDSKEIVPFYFTIDTDKTFGVYEFNLLLVNLSYKINDDFGFFPNPNEIVIQKLELEDKH